VEDQHADRWERLAPLTGIVAVVLWLLAVLILETGDRPGDDASGLEMAAFFEDETGRIFLSYLLWGLGGAFFLWFLGSLRGALAAAEGGVARLSATAFAGGIATVVFALAFPAPEVAGAIRADSSGAVLSPSAAEALFSMGVGFFVAAEVTSTVLLVATALVVLRTRMLPAWLAWASLVFALGLLIFPIGWAVLIFGVPLWTVVVSVLLWRRASASETTAAVIPV